MNVIKNLVKTVLFLAIVVMGIWGLDSLFVAKNLEGRWDTLNTANSFYDLPDDSIDVFFVGTSSIASAVDPFQLYEEYGMSAYNLGMASQSADGTYFWLKEVFKRQSPSLIVMDAKTFGRFKRPIEPYCRKSFDAMRWSKTKLEYAQYYKNEYKKDKQKMIDSGQIVDEDKLTEYTSYFFPLEAYHSRWNSLNELDFVYATGAEESKSLTRGYMMMGGRSGIEYEGIDFDVETEECKLDEEAREYFYKILELCEANNAQLMLVKTPDSDWVNEKIGAAARHQYVQKMADEKGVLFYDMNSKELLKEMELDYKTDASDYMHLNTKGAKKTTSFLGKYIADNFKLKDYRNESGKIRDEIEKGLAAYKCEVEDADLRMTFNITDYYASIENRERYSFIITTGDGFDGTFTENQKQQMYNMGFTRKMVEVIQNNKNMIAIVDGDRKYLEYGDLTDNEANTLSLTREDKLRDGTIIKVVSMKGSQSITIGTNNEIINKYDKCYMITYDNTTHKVVDAVYFDKDDNGVTRTAR